MSPRRSSSTALAIVFVGTLIAFSRGPLRADGPPGQINFQSRLTDSTGRPIPDGIAQLTFTLCADAACTQQVWTETQGSVQVSRGIVSVQLGSTTPLAPTLFDGPTKYLQIQVNGGAPLSPAIPLVSVPYALSAGSINGKTASQLGGGPVGTIVDWFRPDGTTTVPDGWRICDGSVVNDPASPFNGKAVPNLSGQLTRGLNPALVSATSYGAGTANPFPDVGTVVDDFDPDLTSVTFKHVYFGPYVGLLKIIRIK